MSGAGKVLLVHPPRFYWPFVSEDDNFMIPQYLPCLGAYIRRKGFAVEIIDCMPEKIGWQSLERRIREARPRVVASGENHVLYASETLRLFEMVKKIDPDIVTIAGGSHFSNLYEDTLRDHPVDFVVRGEGEETFAELLEELEKDDPRFERVASIAFKREDRVLATEARPLIADLTTLPMPAYDLLKPKLYGKAKYLFSPGGTTIHHSRGCPYSCDFCGWWVQMADTTFDAEGAPTFKPRWRTKSVEQTVEEVELLRLEYDKRCLVFVDESWNVNKKWNDAFAEALLRKPWKVNWFAFMLSDCILRDEEAGILEKLVAAGLTHLCIGVEREGDAAREDVGKHHYSREKLEQVFDLLRTKYPSVFRQATFIVGVRHETEDLLQRQYEFAKRLRLDFPGFHPITPVPGTAYWKEAMRSELLEVRDYNRFDWMTPVSRSEFLTRDEIERHICRMQQKYVTAGWLLRGILSPYKYKRGMYIWWLIVTLRVAWRSVLDRLSPLDPKQYSALRRPAWYEW
ncbi:MAG: B12-binding domain-containing radical SAM protein [Candidatus Methylomirabilis sp.]|nr:B12-binding domain-containing radical SAM protein [Deltaproteobacteria bacterium]